MVISRTASSSLKAVLITGMKRIKGIKTRVQFSNSRAGSSTNV
jgi:hypothetical protein